MNRYKEMYFILFNAITDALEHLGAANYGLACDILTTAQKETESQYVDADA